MQMGSGKKRGKGNAKFAVKGKQICKCVSGVLQLHTLSDIFTHAKVMVSLVQCESATRPIDGCLEGLGTSALLLAVIT